MKSIIPLLFIFISGVCGAQQSGLSLQECIEIALNERPTYKAAKLKSENGVFDIMAAKSAYGPKIGVSYAYRYNAIIPTSLVPRELGGIGAMDNGGDFLELQFGTEWQQDLGITLEQPLFDLKANSEIKESRINQNIYALEEESSKEEVLYKVTESYILLSQREYEVKSAILDTLRTYNSLKLILNGYENGQILKMDLNTARMNHNNTKSVLTTIIDRANTERYNLAFLMGSDHLPNIAGNQYREINQLFAEKEKEISSDKETTEIEILKNENKLLGQQIKTLKTARLPKISFDAFYGANQFSQNLSPFEPNTWFGNSFLGISMKLPILSADGASSKVARLRGEQRIKEQQLLEEMNTTRFENKRLDLTLESLQKEMDFLEQNLALQKENVSLYQARLSNGKANAYELNEQELLVQKTSSELFQKRIQFWGAILEKYNTLGRLQDLINF